MKFLILILVAVPGVKSCRKSCDIDDIKNCSEFSTTQPLRYIKRVLICSNKDASEQIMAHRFNMFNIFPNMNIEFLDVTDCLNEIIRDSQEERSILAIIAPKPFASLSDSEVPIYFYEAPYFLENLEAHSNNVPALIDWRPLKHAFTHFFEQQGWIRIAIVSDDSPYSAAFEEELVGQLNEKQLVYNVQRCVETYGRTCDFEEALTFIQNQKAFIVVANVDANNAPALAKQAQMQHVTRTNGFLWLTRDWPFGDIPKNELIKMGPIVSLTLAPLVKETVSSQISKSLNGPHLACILQGLSLIDDAVKHTKGDRIDHFYRDIAKHMNKAIRKNTHDAQAFIRTIDVNSNEDSSAVITVVVANNGFITSFNTINNFTPGISDVRDCFMMKSSVFTAPCNDLLISGIVLVVLLFILLFLLIIYVNIRFFSYIKYTAVK